MRSALILSFWAATALAQSTFTLPALPGNNEQALSVTLSATATSNIIAWLESAPPNAGWPNSAGQPANTTLGAAITTTGQTSITLVTATNLQPCNGLFIGSELMQVASVVGNTVTVLRAMIGTTATTYTNGTAVTVTRGGGGTCFLKEALADSVQSVVNAKLQGAAITAQTAAITSAQSSIAATVAAAVQ